MNISTLKTLDSSQYQDGYQIYVDTLRTNFQLNLSAIDDSDDISIINAVIGKWIRQITPMGVWSDISVFYWNKKTGNDENLGDQAHPLKTPQEIDRRNIF